MFTALSHFIITTFMFISFSCLVFSSSITIAAFTPSHHRLIDNHPIQFNVNTFHSTTVSTSLTKSPLSRRSPTELIIYNQQRKSMASVQTMSLFGLGGPEIAVIGIAVFFLLGPQKLAEIGREAGKAASDYRDVPKEFQKGFEEGEIEARSRNAKPMDDIDESSSIDDQSSATSKSDSK